MLSFFSYISSWQYQVKYTQTLLCLLYNVACHKDNLPAFFPADNAVNILLLFTHCSLGTIGLLSKCILSFLQCLMEDDQQSNLELTTDETSFFTTSLNTVLESDAATANGFNAEEILTILVNLSTIGRNQSALQNKTIFAAVDTAIRGQNSTLQKLAIHLLLNLMDSSTAKMAIPKSTIFTLQALKDDALSGMGTLAHCLLWSLHQEAVHGEYSLLSDICMVIALGMKEFIP